MIDRENDQQNSFSILPPIASGTFSRGLGTATPARNIPRVLKASFHDLLLWKTFIQRTGTDDYQ